MKAVSEPPAHKHEQDFDDPNYTFCRIELQYTCLLPSFYLNPVASSRSRCFLPHPPPHSSKDRSSPFPHSSQNQLDSLDLKRAERKRDDKVFRMPEFDRLDLVFQDVNERRFGDLDAAAIRSALRWI